eukprot:CAMPEP_0185830080 /NCGR_PEP_ID=MMETSP1353-20130828/616_1 /TAXON_ID=1077150 /ORGANISM="Erythrolobus australicus, Strain CCMP3124" /LENGTH=677 /DNA_ID=CAMNT_0028527937 /DNA_START=309 /DNA_END=2342 /DNA_ORIENTATION=+
MGADDSMVVMHAGGQRTKDAVRANIVLTKNVASTGQSLAVVPSPVHGKRPDVKSAKVAPQPGWHAQLEAENLRKFMREYMGRDSQELQDAMFRMMREDDAFRPRYGMSMHTARELTYERLCKVAAGGFIRCADVVQNPQRFMAGMQSLHFADYTLSIKAGVHYTLCGGTIAKLGTPAQQQRFLPKLDSLELPGCYGMTELGHGSNVMAIETTAKYDATTQSFDLHTPSNLASKFWIGGSAQHGKLCAVFAQLYTPKQLDNADLKHAEWEWRGPHVFLVRIRDDDGVLMPNVRIRDCGSKMGLQGVDNGQIWFDHVKVPREDMLDRFSQVHPDGSFHSAFKSVNQLFGAMVGGLTTGRLLIAWAAVDACKIGLIVAIRYGAKRKQFGEKPIMEYITHQRRLLPALAKSYALELGLQYLGSLMMNVSSSKAQTSAKEVHVLSCGLKAMATWHRTRTLQDCRECCGGMGFLSANQIGQIMTDMNVDTTFEGDNTVLMQQVVKALLGATSKTELAQIEAEQNGSARSFNATDSSQWHAMLSWRERALLADLVRAGSAAFDAKLDVVLAAAEAHLERRLLEIFQSSVAQARSKDAALGAALADVCAMFALSCVEAHLSDYLAREATAPRTAQAVSTAVNVMCERLTGVDSRAALALSAGFGIPEQFITAPISKDWTRMNAKL